MKRKAQSAVEFVVLSGIMFLFFAISIIYVEDLILQFTQANKEQQLVGVRDALVSEIALANRMPQGYVRTFTLPLDIQGLSYRVTIETEPPPRKDAIVVRTIDSEVLTYLDYDVTGTITPGTNTISRSGTVDLN